MPRNSRLTPGTIRLLIDALRAGRSIREACVASSISHVTFYAWLGKGKRGESGFAEFSSAVFAAIDAGDRARLDEVLAALKEQPVAAV